MRKQQTIDDEIIDALRNRGMRMKRFHPIISIWCMMITSSSASECLRAMHCGVKNTEDELNNA